MYCEHSKSIKGGCAWSKSRVRLQAAIPGNQAVESFSMTQDCAALRSLRCFARAETVSMEIASRGRPNSHWGRGRAREIELIRPVQEAPPQCRPCRADKRGKRMVSRRLGAKGRFYPSLGASIASRPWLCCHCTVAEGETCVIQLPSTARITGIRRQGGREMARGVFPEIGKTGGCWRTIVCVCVSCSLSRCGGCGWVALGVEGLRHHSAYAIGHTTGTNSYFYTHVQLGRQ